MGKKKNEMSKELQDIMDAIEVYVKKHDKEVCFIADFYAFEGENCDVIDDRVCAYGKKECLLIALEEMTKQIKKEKGDFINW